MESISGIILIIVRGIKSSFVLNNIRFYICIRDRLNTQPVQLIFHDDNVTCNITMYGHS